MCPERIAADVSKGLDDIKTGVSSLSRDEPGGCPLMVRWCPAWRRREPGLRLLYGTGEGRFRYFPFGISKWAVQEAWEGVKANKGAPGVESDVVGKLLSASGACGADTQAAWWRDQNVEHTHGGANGGG